MRPFPCRGQFRPNPVVSLGELMRLSLYSLSLRELQPQHLRALRHLLVLRRYLPLQRLPHARGIRLQSHSVQQLQTHRQSLQFLAQNRHTRLHRTLGTDVLVVLCMLLSQPFADVPAVWEIATVLRLRHPLPRRRGLCPMIVCGQCRRCSNVELALRCGLSLHSNPMLQQDAQLTRTVG